MRLPNLSPPVKRPHFTQLSSNVDMVNDRVKDFVTIPMSLLHEINYNDPAIFEYRSYKQVMTSAVRRAVNFTGL